MSRVAFSDLRTAAYCPRKLYYRRDDDREPPPRVATIRALATRYPALLEADDSTLATEPIALEPSVYRARLASTRERLRATSNGLESLEEATETDGSARDVTQTTHDRWAAICAPIETDAFVAGRDCHGIVHKILADPLEPVLVSTGRPPDNGVWESQTVHAVAAAKALAWTRGERVGGAWVEYPAYGRIRYVPMTTRRKAAYRRTLREVRELDGPPPRLQNSEKCEHCEYADTCGVRTRSLRSLLGFG